MLINRIYWILRIAALYSLLFVFQGCKSVYTVKPFSSITTPKSPNYQLEQNWAVLPSKYPSELKKFSSSEIDTLSADVFYVYPTLLTNKKDERWNVSTSDSDQNQAVLNKAVKYQASAWATSGKLYVPYYRQAHLKAYTNLNNGGHEALSTAYEDVKKAFMVYLEKYNNGRPIIIASHSQGTTHTIKLLKEFFDGKPLQKQLIAAYLIGIGVKPADFESIMPMIEPDEVGGFVSWNTFKKGHFPKRDKNWYKGSVTSNPITWDQSQSTSLSDHRGFLFSNDKLYRKSLKIWVTDGLVWSTNPKFPLRFFMSFRRNYHIGDVNLFWQDIRENAVLRTNTWHLKHH